MSSNAFESIVRPFQDLGVSPPQQYFPVGQVGIPPVIVRAGRSGGGRVLNGSFSSTQTTYMTRYDNEKKNATFGRAF